MVKRKFLFVFVSIVAIHAALFAETYRGNFFDSTKAGAFGDFVGGYIGTLILVASVVLLLESNEDNRNANKQSAFEGRFFEMLRYHRENVAEMKVGGKIGHGVFVSLIREFREVHAIVRVCRDSFSSDLEDLDCINVAYVAFYYGVGPNSSRLLKAALNSKCPCDFIDGLVDRMADVQMKYRNYESNADRRSVLEPQIQHKLQQEFSELTRLSYCPFDGHQSRLGHYFRHLYQTVKYAHANSHGAAASYVDILRAQLANHEQALFCLNALSFLGRAWISEEYIDRYGMVKNLPENFFDSITEFDLKRTFPNVSFEYAENNVETKEPNRL